MRGIRGEFHRMERPGAGLSGLPWRLVAIPCGLADSAALVRKLQRKGRGV